MKNSIKFLKPNIHKDNSITNFTIGNLTQMLIEKLSPFGKHIKFGKLTNYLCWTGIKWKFQNAFAPQTLLRSLGSVHTLPISAAWGSPVVPYFYSISMSICIWKFLRLECLIRSLKNQTDGCVCVLFSAVKWAWDYILWMHFYYFLNETRPCERTKIKYCEKAEKRDR